MLRLQPGSTLTDTLFPYTTLFRSCSALLSPRCDGGSSRCALRRKNARSALLECWIRNARSGSLATLARPSSRATPSSGSGGSAWACSAATFSAAVGVGGALRSEVHTYELQSLMRLSYSVFCLFKTFIYLVLYIYFFLLLTY